MSDPIIQGRGNHRYKWIDQWALLPGDKQLGYTHYICEVNDGRIFIHNRSKDSAAIFSPDGEFLDSWGEDYIQGAHGMQLSAEDDGEFLYFAPDNLSKIFKTTLDGEIVFEFGIPRECKAYDGNDRFYPTNIAIASNGDFYVADGYGLSFIHQ